MNKCFEINKDGGVHQGVFVGSFTKLIEGITRPSIVVGGKGLGSQYGILPIYVYDNHYYKTNDEKVIRYTDKDSRVYGLWMEFANDKPHPQFDPKLTFDNVHNSPDGFGSSNAIVAFRTHNRCIGIEAYTSENETITCIDEMCRLQYIGKPRSMPRRCRECDGKVKSTFRPFPGIILTDGNAYDDGDAQIGTEIVAQIPNGHAFRVMFTIDEDKRPIERYYQFNGDDIESLGQFKEDRHGYIRKVKPKG